MGTIASTSFLAENIVGCDEVLMCAQGLQSYQISNTISVEKNAECNCFSNTLRGGGGGRAKKVYYLRKAAVKQRKACGHTS